ncbi:hypothetical protein GCU60_18195 [Blastococcus saxobsidens]|uniref:Uncharacterized protein n=1 Tax=Blastococcus saxobsidens TaxID=138336 RepID=A0A6L9W6E9_9ACTN|nr:hypothetical protein [Blastococcus saxobsidens]NEK87673.1 hypothetical protein [Blastococcus saxobsidens]
MPFVPLLGPLRAQAATARVPHGGLARPALAFAGVALLVTGAVGVFVSTNATGTAALVAAGLALVAIAVYGDRIETVEAAGLKVQLQQAAASQLVAATEAEAAGDLQGAQRLREQAARLLEAARTVATRYQAIRATQPSSWQRTERLQELIAEESRTLSGAVDSPEAVRELFRAGDEGYRILAIGMMSANPALADPETIADAVSSPRTAFEQFHALRAAEALASRQPPPPGVDAVREAVRAASSSDGLGAPDSDRGRLARRVLELLP